MENLYYYFYNYNVETATVKILLEDWQELTQEEIEIYKSGDYSSIEKINDHYCFSKSITINQFNLETYKIEKIQELSYLSLSVGEVVAPTYKFYNCLLSKEMEENGEDPIYTDWKVAMNEFKSKRVALRNEFYRLKSIVENAETKDEIDQLFTPNVFILWEENII